MHYVFSRLGYHHHLHNHQAHQGHLSSGISSWTGFSMHHLLSIGRTMCSSFVYGDSWSYFLCTPYLFAWQWQLITFIRKGGPGGPLCLCMATLSRLSCSNNSLRWTHLENPVGWLPTKAAFTSEHAECRDTYLFPFAAVIWCALVCLACMYTMSYWTEPHSWRCLRVVLERCIELQPNCRQVRFSCTFPTQHIEQPSKVARIQRLQGGGLAFIEGVWHCIITGYSMNPKRLWAHFVSQVGACGVYIMDNFITKPRSVD